MLKLISTLYVIYGGSIAYVILTSPLHPYDNPWFNNQVIIYAIMIIGYFLGGIMFYAYHKHFTSPRK